MSTTGEDGYTGKHPPGTEVDAALTAAVRQRERNSRLTCRAAHQIAGEFEVDPLQVGTALDLLDYRIERCQLGLFGYRPEKKVVRPAEDVGREMRARLLSARDAHGKVTCRDCWRIADALRAPRMKTAAACEAMGIKIVRCQLGAF